MDKIADVSNISSNIPSRIRESTKKAMAKAINASEEDIKRAEANGWTLWKSFKVLKGEVVAEKGGVIYGPITSIDELLVTEKMGGIDSLRGDTDGEAS